ncbi:MAG: hypothetical protein Q9160_008629 [Pyrenula sp. 1 TL-2023]
MADIDVKKEQGVRIELIDDDPRAIENMLLVMYGREPDTCHWTDGEGKAVAKFEADVCVFALARRYGVDALESMMKSRIHESLSNWDMSRAPEWSSSYGPGAGNLVRWTIKLLEIFKRHLGRQPLDFMSYIQTALNCANLGLTGSRRSRRRMKQICHNDPEFTKLLPQLFSPDIIESIMDSY